MQESLWSPVVPEKILWITSQLVFSFNVLAFWLLEQAWAGRSKCHPPKMSFVVPTLSFLFCTPTHCPQVFVVCERGPGTTRATQNAQVFQGPVWFLFLENCTPWAVPMTADWGTWESIFSCRDTTGFWCICFERHSWGDTHTHTHPNISPFLLFGDESPSSRPTWNSMNSRSSDRISPWQIPHALTITSQAPCNPSRPLQCSAGWIQHPRAQSSRGVCSPQSQPVKTCLSVNIHWIPFFLDYISLKLVILSKMDVLRKARWQVGTSSKRSWSWKNPRLDQPRKRLTPEFWPYPVTDCCQLCSDCGCAGAVNALLPWIKQNKTKQYP